MHSLEEDEEGAAGEHTISCAHEARFSSDDTSYMTLWTL